ncbi:hypothetical protein HMPREF1015_02251 [Bacillus smithii 7_3_47FAA]|uniref:Transposase IS204/IS1001/IS1096/IS1165 zinc-finger domain-containing protein n=1 Tax=Bacillus smithii 7_3_47FAA TaxID=665952 RepID=G9QIG0_9BACI|nr:hypothetical protein HMPREF1015_02251 [Bacillus smithii 7_3_47FAA]
MRSHLITKLLGLEDVEITHVEDQITHFEIHIQTPVKVQKCPCCQKETSSVYDYRGKNLYSINFPCISFCTVFRPLSCP